MIKTNMVKAKEIAHSFRRIKRDADMKPLDIEATIPAKSVGAEKSRQAIRNIDAATQVSIDAATDEAGLKAILCASCMLP